MLPCRAHSIALLLGLASWSDLIRRHLLRATRDQRPLGSKIFTTTLSFVFYRSDVYDAIDLNVTVMKRYNSISGALHIIPSQRYRSVHTINLQVPYKFNTPHFLRLYYSNNRLQSATVCHGISVWPESELTRELPATGFSLLNPTTKRLKSVHGCDA